MKKGDKVVQVVKPIKGSIINKTFDDDLDEFLYLVEFEMGNETRQAQFRQSQLKPDEGN